jgi:uridine kinase
LLPFSRGEPVRYEPSDWGDGPGDAKDIKPRAFTILEGVGASRAELRPYLACTVWIDAPPDLRLERGLERDGPDSAERWRSWMAQEVSYVTQQGPKQRADFVLDGADPTFARLR